MKSSSRSTHNGLSNIPRASAQVAKYYDDWATEYNESLANWNYDAPEQVAFILRSKLPPDSVILDAGCGTGLSGSALKLAGFSTIHGIDVSPRSLEVAGNSGTYHSLQTMDMQQFPFALPDSHYDGLICVGVLTYLTDSAATLREFSRIVRPGGVMVLTQRSDLFIERKFETVLVKLSSERLIERVRISEPRPYLPANDEFSDKILVHYITCTVV